MQLWHAPDIWGTYIHKWHTQAWLLGLVVKRVFLYVSGRSRVRLSQGANFLFNSPRNIFLSRHWESNQNSRWTPEGLLVESVWTPEGLRVDSSRTPLGLQWTPGGLRPNPWLSVKSSVCGLHEASHTNLYCLWELSSYIRNTVSDSAVGDTWASSSSNSYSKILRK